MSIKNLLGMVCAALLAGSLFAADVVLNPDHPDRYVVVKGDTLWDIAQKYPGVSDTDISRWNNLSNSNRIKPGQKIRIRKM